MGVFVGVLALWDRVADELRAAWHRYRDWAQAGLDWLLLPLSPLDILLRHILFIIGGCIAAQLMELCLKPEKRPPPLASII